MRHIILDTETTGLDPTRDKIVEIGAVELIDLRPTGREYHVYANPGIPVPAAATDVHGLTDAFLADYPPLDTAPLLEFLADSAIVAHNAAFDMAFLRAAGIGATNEVIDTLALARKRHPLASNTLDALCRRYHISTASRTKHGALIDAQLLAQVYVELIGRQDSFNLEIASRSTTVDALPARPRALPSRLTPAETKAHAAMVAGIPKAIWCRLGQMA